MKAVVSRVSRASVVADGLPTGAIERGLVVYVGVVEGDGPVQAQWLANKLVALRIFSDEQGKLNLSVADVGGGLLLIPNFTLAGRTKKGTRPSFTDAADPAAATTLFDAVVEHCSRAVLTATGVFGANMQIDSVADGPVTILLDTAP